MLVHRRDLSVETRIGDVARAVRFGNDVEVNRDGDGTRRVDACAVGWSRRRRTAALRRAVGRHFPVDLLNFHVVGVARAALLPASVKALWDSKTVPSGATTLPSALTADCSPGFSGRPPCAPAFFMGTLARRNAKLRANKTRPRVNFFIL
jgi:hypothetical protein